jgi:hypothetical protein
MAKKKSVVATKVQAAEASATLDAVKEIKVPSVVDDFSKLGSKVLDTLSGLQGEVTKRINLLDTINGAISLQEKRLQELHGVEAATVSLDEVKAGIESEKAAWEAEKAELEKDQQREEEEYNYNLAQQRKLQNDQFESTLAKRKREEELRKEVLEREWADIKLGLENRKSEYDAAAAKLATFDSAVKANVDREVAIATNSLKRSYEHEKALTQKDYEATIKVMESENNNLSKQVSSLLGEVSNLKSDLVGARNDAKDVATKALEASSGRQALEELRRAGETNAGAVSNKGR